MHKLIDETAVECIRATGKSNPELADRIPILEAHRLPYDRAAENVLVSGCQILPTMPNLLDPLARLFTQKGLSYTMLSTEYCCGNYLYRPAIQAKGLRRINLNIYVKHAMLHAWRKLTDMQSKKNITPCGIFLTKEPVGCGLLLKPGHCPMVERA